MALIEILSEQEHAGGWTFQASVDDDAGGEPRDVRLTLSWADYNLWSPDGGDAPERVAGAVLAFLLTKQKASEIRPSFDAAIVRRQFRDADDTIPKLVVRKT